MEDKRKTSLIFNLMIASGGGNNVWTILKDNEHLHQYKVQTLTRNNSQTLDLASIPKFSTSTKYCPAL